MFVTLRTNPSITLMRLGATKIKEKGLKSLAELLRCTSTHKFETQDQRIAKQRSVNWISTHHNFPHLVESGEGRRDQRRGHGGHCESQSRKHHNHLHRLGRKSNSKRLHSTAGRALGGNSTIISLSLGHTLLGEEGLSSLVAAFRVNSTIRSLNLERNILGDGGVEILAGVLRVNSVITSLNLKGNNIEDEGVEILAEVLHGNSSLTSLNLGVNNIGDEGVQFLANVLRGNPTISTLNIGVNSFGVGGMRVLAETRANSSMTSFGCANSCGDEGLKAVADALTFSSSLTRLKVGRLWEESGKKILQQAGKRSYSVVSSNFLGLREYNRNYCLASRKSATPEGWNFEEGEFIQWTTTYQPLKIPASIVYKIQKVILQGCHLKNIPAAIIALPNLSTLDVG